MNFMKTKSLALLAVGMAVAACDPFPATPKVDLSVVHIGTTGANPQDVENTATGVTFTDVGYNASLYVWFSKEMDGSSIQKVPNYDAAGAALDIADACAFPGSPLAATSILPADALVCYAPGSALDGGYIQVFHADGGYWDVGSYKLAGTVRDYEGKSLAISATFDVTLMPTLVKADQYTIDIAWPNQAGVTDYLIEVGTGTPIVWSTLKANQAWVEPAAAVSKVNGSIRHWGLVPGAKYSYRVTPNGVTGAVASTVTSTTLSAAPTPKAVANPVSSTNPAGDPGAVQLTWTRIRDNAAGTPAQSSATYRVETRAAAADPWTVLTTIAPTSSAVVAYKATGLAVGDHSFQVVPVFTNPAGGAAVDGTPTKTATATVAF
jgi:hypothetical protein